MAISRFEPETIQEFQTKIEQELTKGRVFCYFFASELEDTGKSWCPDCVKAEPTLEKVFETSSSTGVTLLKIPVGQRDKWRDPENMWRVDPLLNLKYVPTLVEIGENGKFLKRKLVEAEIWEQALSIL